VRERADTDRRLAPAFAPDFTPDLAVLDLALVSPVRDPEREADFAREDPDRPADLVRPEADFAPILTDDPLVLRPPRADLAELLPRARPLVFCFLFIA
jgi:hypothetical protein